MKGRIVSVMWRGKSWQAVLLMPTADLLKHPRDERDAVMLTEADDLVPAIDCPLCGSFPCACTALDFEE